MDWNRSTVIGLASACCTTCQGHGTRSLGGRPEGPCSCVFRAIFRACYRKFREFASQSIDAGLVSLEHVDGPVGRRVYSLKREEYLADFNLIARRVLTDNDYRLFRFTFLL